jgi:hypothetical protein
MTYERKSVLLNTATGTEKRYDQVIKEYFNNNTIFYSQAPKEQWDSLWYYFLARVTRNDSAGAAASLDDIVGSSSGRIELYTKLAQYTVAAWVEDARVEEAKKNGVGKLANAWASELNDAMVDLAKQLNEDYYADNTTSSLGDAVNGLRGVLQTTGTIFGQSLTTYTKLKANVDSSVGDLSISDFREYYTTLLENGARREDLVVYTTYTVMNYLIGKMDENKFYLGTSAKAGFEGQLTIDGIPIIPDDNCPSGYMFILDRTGYKIVEMIPPSMGTKELGKKNLTDTKYIWTIQNLVTTKFNTHYKLSGITS